jgi:opacity protein-like surface antigen
MRSLYVMLLCAAAAYSQPFGFGIKVGVPMTDFLSAARSQTFNFSAATNRYVIGPTAELRLPFGLGVEVDALYRHYGYTGVGNAGLGSTTNSTTSGGAWEFPLLAKYKFKAPLLRPFVVAGVAWDKLSGLTQAVTSTFGGNAKSSTTSNPPELNKNVTRGFVFGGGVDVKLLLLHVAPEIRYTRWGDQHFIDPNGLLHSNLNQAEFLVGITF